MSMILYFLKVSVALILFWLMYRLVFKKLTFFTFNRFFLLGSIVLSFTLPLVRLIDRPLNVPLVDYSLGINWEHIALVPQKIEPSASLPSSGFSLSVLLWIYLIVVSVFLIKGMLGFLSVRRKYATGYIEKKSGISYVVNRNLKVPFTLFRTIYLDPVTYEEGIIPVIRHEMVHARQLHTVDLIFIEIVCAFLWFNPFVFLFRRYIRDNHEYLADNLAVEDRSDLIQYMQVLSETVSRTVYPVYASYFASSTLKKRIIMLTNKKSRSNKKFLYLFIIPVIGLAVMSFQEPAEHVLSESALVQIDKSTSKASVYGEEPGIPARFPLDAKFRKSVTADFDREMKHPITGEIMNHKGVDFAAPTGSPVYATAGGVIAKSENHEKYGKLIIIKHADTYASLYAHMDELFFESGENVKKGQKIGTVGSTGLSTGPHLHYEVRKDGEHMNPADYY